MAKRSDVFLSMRPEEESENDRIESYQEETEAVTDSPQQQGDWVIFKLVKSNKKGGGKYPDGMDDIPDPRKGGKGKVRIRLLKGVGTIFQDEQKEVDKDYIRQNRMSLHFPARENMMRINTDDSSLLEFARKSSLNVDNSYHRKSDLNYYEYNPAKVAERALQKEMFELNMARKAEKQDEITMRKHAYFLGVAATDSYGIPKPPDRIRAEYIIAAKRNPERFEKTLGSQEVEVAYLVRRAISEAFIEVNATDVNWASGGFIGKIPGGSNPIDYLIELALLKTKDGKDFLSQLQVVVK